MEEVWALDSHVCEYFKEESLILSFGGYMNGTTLTDQLFEIKFLGDSPTRVELNLVKAKGQGPERRHGHRSCLIG